jgi:hypothetical protein
MTAKIGCFLHSGQILAFEKGPSYTLCGQINEIVEVYCYIQRVFQNNKKESEACGRRFLAMGLKYKL